MPYAAILPITKADTMSETFIHPSSFVDDGAVIGPGCRIWHFSHIMAGAVLGPACNIGQNVMVAADVKLGRQVKVQNNVSRSAGTPSWARGRSLRARSPIMPSLRGCPHAWSDG